VAVTRSDGFSVDPGELDKITHDVGQAARDMTEVARMPELPAKVFGHDDLAKSAAEFQDSWQHGVEELSRDVGTIYSGMGEIVRHYRRVDEDVAARFDAIGRGEQGV
jgi:hypothetical protein